MQMWRPLPTVASSLAVLVVLCMLMISGVTAARGLQGSDADTACRCTRELNPTCSPSTNITYANPCLAACNNATDAVPGRCSTSEDASSCACPYIYLPVCGEKSGANQTYPNECVATCDGAVAITDGACDLATQGTGLLDFLFGWLIPGLGDDDNSGGHHGNGGGGGNENGNNDNDDDDDDDGDDGGHPGGDDNDNDDDDGHHHGGDFPSNPCVCPLILMPVCGKDGRTYPSPCVAQCNGTRVEAMGPCGGFPARCSCNLFDFNPVCGADNMTYPSSCWAKCAQVEYVDGWCGISDDHNSQPSIFDDPKSSCFMARDVVARVCVLKAGARTSQEFQNPCYALEAGVDLSKGDRYQKGSCKPECDARCASVDVSTEAVVQGLPAPPPICCVKPVTAEYISTCYAQCINGLTDEDISTCNPGLCKRSRASTILRNSKCEGGVNATVCEDRRPCDSSTCNVVNATCVNTQGCVKLFRLDRLTTGCGAYWLDQEGSLIKGCGALP